MTLQFGLVKLLREQNLLLLSVKFFLLDLVNLGIGALAYQVFRVLQFLSAGCGVGFFFLGFCAAIFLTEVIRGQVWVRINIFGTGQPFPSWVFLSFNRDIDSTGINFGIRPIFGDSYLVRGPIILQTNSILLGVLAIDHAIDNFRTDVAEIFRRLSSTDLHLRSLTVFMIEQSRQGL